MQYWLVKSEPSEWSFADHVKAGISPWTGVKNAQAQSHMRQMKRGDEVLFYHTGDEKQIVGTLTVIAEFRPDPQDDTGKRGIVTFRAGKPLKIPVTLAAIKADKRLAHLPLIKQPRLSVMPLDAAAWKVLTDLGAG